jgi:hypothetical protein
MAFDEERGTKELLNMQICRERLLKDLNGGFKTGILVYVLCLAAMLAITIPITASAISEINDIEVFDFLAFCYCVLLVLSVAVCVFFVVGPFFMYLYPVYLDLRRVQNGQFRVVKDMVYETGRMYISGRSGSSLHKYVEFDHFGRWWGRSIERAEHGDTYYLLLFQKRKKEKIYEVFSTKAYKWDDAQNPIDE